MVLLIVTFIVPLIMVLGTSVADEELSKAMPGVAALVRDWDGVEELPSDAGAILAREIGAALPERVAALGRRLSYEDPKLATLLRTTSKAIKADPGSAVQLDPRWTEVKTWQTLKRAAGPVDGFYLLTALDMRWEYGRGPHDVGDGGLYREILMRTLVIAFYTTCVTILLGFPLSFFLSRVGPTARAVGILVVLLPFWTSIVVRTTAWIVLLQTRGVINQVLQRIGLIDQPLELLHNRLAVIIVLTHVMLPFLVLPLLSAMRAVDHRLLQAAASMGAPPLYAFWSVYIPQIFPGLLAGVMLVFVMSLGFYITPALVGGAADQTIGAYIALFTTGTANWGLASSLGLVLTGLTATLLAVRALLSGRNQKAAS
jgi:putative spermidine/putrescine transport system permease protein